jgi:hypothetical protein
MRCGQSNEARQAGEHHHADGLLEHQGASGMK